MIRLHSIYRPHTLHKLILAIFLCSLTPTPAYARVIIPRDQTDKAKDQANKSSSPAQTMYTPTQTNSKQATLSKTHTNRESDAKTSLPFPIQAIATDKSNIYMGASIPGTQEFAVSALAGNQKEIYGITPKTIRLNNIKDQPNPLFDAAIEHLSLIKKETMLSSTEHLAAITKKNPDTIYVFENNIHDLRSLSAIPDATGAATSKIVALTTGNQGTIFMATKPHEISSQFGDTGSGIAVAVFQQGAPTTFCLINMALNTPNQIAHYKTIPDITDTNIADTLNQVTPDTIIPDITASNIPDTNITETLITETLGQITPDITDINKTKIRNKKKVTKKRPNRVVKKTFDSKAAPLNKNTSALKIGSGDIAAIIGDTAVLHWDKTLQRLFIGLNIVTGNTGGRSLIVGRFKEGKLVFEPIAPETLFDASNTHIVGTTDSNASLSIHQLASMTTSTHMHYLIVRGGNGNSKETANSIYALGLINNHQSPEFIGTIAAKNAPISYVKSHNSFQQHHRAKNSEQMTHSTDPAAAIGQGPLNSNWGTITNMIVNKDCVYAIVHNETDNAGIFQSQALFDHTGTIKRWTEWQRYAGVYNDLLLMLIDTNTGVLTAITSPLSAITDNNNSNHPRETNITRTEWSRGDEKLSAPLFASIGPVSCMKDFCPSTPGLSSISVIATAYNDQITLAQTGTMDESGLITPTTGNNIALKQFKGGALSHISPLTDITLAYCPDRNQGFICCAGSRGVAILTDETGNGYNKISAGLEELNDTAHDMSNKLTFKILGDYQWVKRVVADGNYLYILTDTTLDRIELTRENTRSKTDTNMRFTPVRLADIKQQTFNQLFFKDIVISGKLGLLATSNGLFRVGDGMNIATASNPESLGWARIATPDNISRQITHLYATSGTARKQDCAQKNSDGHLYVLSANRGLNKGQLYRFSLESVTDTNITSTTVQPFLSDFFYATKTLIPIPSFWVNLQNFCDLFITDGTLSFFARGQENKAVSYLKILNSPLAVGGNISKGNDIPSMVRNSAAGTWLIGNETGIYTLE